MPRTLRPIVERTGLKDLSFLRETTAVEVLLLQLLELGFWEVRCIGGRTSRTTMKESNSVGAEKRG